MSQMSHKESYGEVLLVYCTLDVLVINREIDRKMSNTFGVSLLQLRIILRSRLSITYYMLLLEN